MDSYFEYKRQYIIKNKMNSMDKKGKYEYIFYSIKCGFITNEEYEFIMDYYFNVNN